MKNKAIIELIAAALIGVLSYASLSKLLSYPVFVGQLHMHPLLKPYAGFLAGAVPAIELIVALLLVIPHTRLTGLYSAAGVLSIFTLYLSLMLVTEKDLPCSCGGIISSLSWGQHIVFNGILIVLSGTAIIINKRKDKSRKIWVARWRLPLMSSWHEKS